MTTKSTSCRTQNLRQESLFACQGLSPGCVPDGQAEPDLVDEVSKIVDQVERSIRDLAQQVTEEVTQRVDGPTNGHNETHEVVRIFHGRTQVVLGNIACFTSKDLKEDEAPASHAHSEANPGIDDHGLTQVSKEEHQHSAAQEAEEHA